MMRCVVYCPGGSRDVAYDWLIIYIKEVGNLERWHRDGPMGETAYHGLSVGRAGRRTIGETACTRQGVGNVGRKAIRCNILYRCE